MKPKQLWRAGLAVSVGIVLAAVAAASDDDSEPLYVIHNGKRIPTVIIPPSATQRALLEVVERDSRPAVEDDEGDELGSLSDDDPDEDGEATYDGLRRYVVGQYAGYPVSIPCIPRAGWGYTQPMPPEYYGDVIKETYRAQRWVRDQERGRISNVRDMKRRKTRLLASHEKALRLGLGELRSGQYAQAVVALQMAAELNHGDPACRIHLAQARMAQGHYEDAGEVLRRALQLQPKLAYVSLDLASRYREPEEFDRHVDALAAHIKEARRGVNTWFLLGYMEFQRGNLDEANAAFKGVAGVMPKDSLTETYLKITKPARK